MDSKKSARRVSRPWAKADLDVSGKEVTLRGREQQDEMQNDPMIIGIEYVTREQRNTHKLQNRALIGLALALLENLIIVVMLVVGVAEHWFDVRFAEFTLVNRPGFGGDSNL
jgi:hypothetical protein